MKAAIATVVVVILLAILGPQTLYTVDETQVAVVTQFGEIKRVETSPGLKAKIPFVQQANYFDKRLLRVDLPQDELPDVDKQFLNIDAYVRYRIGHTENGEVVVSAGDVKRFRESLRSETAAASRITEIVASALKQEIGQRTREEVIGAQQVVIGGVETTLATNSRQEILDIVRATAEETIQSSNDGRGLGITLVDVRIKRADFLAETQDAIFDRMRAERLELSAGFRSEGGRERAVIEADVNKDVAIILSLAEREANTLRGEGEAEAIRILAESLGKDPEFFAFRRSLEAYKKFLSQNTTVVLSSDAELFQFLDTTKPSAITRSTAMVGDLESIEGNVWTVAGRTVRLEGTTDIRTGDAAGIGNTFFVEGTPQDDGSILAINVSQGLRGRLLSIIPERRFTLSEQVVVITDATDVQASPGQVTRVYVEGERRLGDLEATLITEGLSGTLADITEQIWTVGITVFTVDNDTKIDVGADQVGASLVVSVSTQPDGSLLALKVRLQPEAEEAEVLAGAVSALAAVWILEGLATPIYVDAESDRASGVGQVGLDLLVGYERLPDGALRALQIKIAP